METGENRPSGVVVPSDYVEFVHLYYNKIREQVAAFQGINFNDIEDITQDIVMQFIAGNVYHPGGYLTIYNIETQQAHAEARYKDQLAEFEAGETEYRPIKHKGLFTSFVYEFTKRRLLGIRDKTNRKYKKEGKSLDEFFEQTEGEDEQSLYALVGHCDNEYFAIDLRNLLTQTVKSLKYYTQPTGTRNLPELFQAIVNATFIEKDGFNRETYAAQKGITVSAVSMQIRDLRDHLKSFKLDKDLMYLLNYRSKAEMADKDSK